jgi:tRNA G18 (ribose-2'-O)-methylase SpoU
MSCEAHNPLLDMYRDLRHAQTLHTSSKVFLTDGEKITLTVLESELSIASILLTEDLFLKHEVLIRSRLSDEHILIMPKKEMDALVGIDLHSPMMSIVYTPPPCEIHSLKSPIIALNGIVNSDNVGGIIRNAIGLGFESIITDSTTSSPYLRRSIRVSMGSIAFAKCGFSQNLKQDLEQMKSEKGLKIISAEINSYSRSLNDYDFPQDFIVVLGSEGNGIDENILAISDDIVHISMDSRVKSLNVSSSSAIILHAARQRNQQCG